MALLIDQLAAYLQAQGIGTVATDLFRFHRPSQPAAAVSIHPTGGYTPNPYTRAEYPTVQVVARATTPDGAMRKAYAIYNKLHGLQHVDLGSGLFALGIEAADSPVYIGTEQAGSPAATCHLASVNFVIYLRQPSS